MKIKGLAKTSLVDYTGYVATTVFTGGCNMRCPFCHNKDLVFSDEEDFMSLEEFFDFLLKRKGIIEAVCVTGGEPTLQDGLEDFLREIKGHGFRAKLDTNGLKPDLLSRILENALVDYVAMDIKNSKEKYHSTAGISQDKIKDIEKSVNILIDSDIDYEFRTTLVKEFHTLDDLILITEWIKGSKNYFLQQYKRSNQQISPVDFTPYSDIEMENILSFLREYSKNIYLR